MEDRSMIKPILSALEYFNDSEEELLHYYKIIDKFCANWFGKPVLVSKFNNVDLLLIHDILGEYLRFEGNNKKIALWLLSINRVCYNFTADLTSAKKEIEEISKIPSDELDVSLIEPILKNLKQLEDNHLTAGVSDNASQDIIGNFLQWVGIYTTFIYPSLENKTDFYDKNVLRAMNFLLAEFILQRSNDKRLAFLLMAIMEACKQYSLQKSGENPEFIKSNSQVVLPGKEEALVQELLNTLRRENEKQRSRPILTKEILADQFLKDSFDNFINDLNADEVESVTIFNNFSFNLAKEFLSFDTGKQFLFLQTLSRYRTNVADILKPKVHENLKKSVSLLSSRTKDWFKSELDKLNDRKDVYIEYIIHKIMGENSTTKANTAKLFIMLYLIKKLNLM
ncbi:MAG TPA: hypothetical protein PK899_05475 [Spirochaetota bacterium]|jgi:hypothetical protein|nr:hypothetical protein [Spirochaetota bacterium]